MLKMIEKLCNRFNRRAKKNRQARLSFQRKFGWAGRRFFGRIKMWKINEIKKEFIL